MQLKNNNNKKSSEHHRTNNIYIIYNQLSLYYNHNILYYIHNIFIKRQSFFLFLFSFKSTVNLLIYYIFYIDTTLDSSIIKVLSEVHNCSVFDKLYIFYTLKV